MTQRASPSSKSSRAISLALNEWTQGRIKAACAPAYRQYERSLKEHYIAYFSRHPKLRCPRQIYSARNIAAALPPGWSELQRMLPPYALHPYARSAKSSQILTLALLGAAALNDASLRWLWKACKLPDEPVSSRPAFAFEHQLSPSLLDEHPHTTQLDFCVDDPSCFVAVECKWSEQGFGTCSCLRNGEGSPLAGGYCAQRVIDRSHYWQVARDYFNLSPERLPLLPCQLSAVYQAVRNVAAARRLAAHRRPFAFVLLYDAKNPFFRTTGAWPGWPAVLHSVLDSHEAHGLFFRAVAWQELIKVLPLDNGIRRWAREKHRLGR